MKTAQSTPLEYSINVQCTATGHDMPGTFISPAGCRTPVSPVFRDLAELYPWMRANGWMSASSETLPWGVARVAQPATSYKLVEWAYPTSDNAKRFGFPKGCWVYEEVVPSASGESLITLGIAGFATEEEAINAAEKSVLPWLPSYAKFRPYLFTTIPAL